MRESLLLLSSRQLGTLASGTVCCRCISATGAGSPGIRFRIDVVAVTCVRLLRILLHILVLIGHRRSMSMWMNLTTSDLLIILWHELINVIHVMRLAGLMLLLLRTQMCWMHCHVLWTRNGRLGSELMRRQNGMIWCLLLLLAGSGKAMRRRNSGMLLLDCACATN